MGADQFFDSAKGVDAQTAFETAKAQAEWEFGHGGYTGTLAEKRTFVMIEDRKVETRADAMRLAEELLEKRDKRVDDKWGPAGCIEYAPGEFLFFGWASS